MYFLISLPPSTSTLFPYTTLFRSVLGISRQSRSRSPASETYPSDMPPTPGTCPGAQPSPSPIGGPATEALLCAPSRSEEHTSELQSRFDLVCRLLLEIK